MLPVISIPPSPSPDIELQRFIGDKIYMGEMDYRLQRKTKT